MSSIVHSQVADIPYNMTSTGFDVPGFQIVDNLGVVRGVVVRSRSVFGTVGAGLQTLLGGNISIFTELAERTRRQAFDTMLSSMAHGGKIAMLGIPSGPMEVDWNKVVFNMLTIKGIYGREMYETWYMMTVMLQSGLDISPVITHRFPAREFEQGFAAMNSGRSGKVILDWKEL